MPKPQSRYAPFLSGFMCCRVCGDLWEVESAVAPAIKGMFIPTDGRGHIPVCREGPCRQELDAEINRLIKLGWQKLLSR